jgi:hypothetical protein
MKTFIAAALAAISSATLLSADDKAFFQHVSKYGLSYGTVEEFDFRADIFKTRHAEIAEFNSSNQTSTVGHN